MCIAANSTAHNNDDGDTTNNNNPFPPSSHLALCGHRALAVACGRGGLALVRHNFASLFVHAHLREVHVDIVLTNAHKHVPPRLALAL
jgi:hypothetical protein